MRNHNLPKYLSDASNSRGLYDPCFEHDACGVGMVCQMKGEKSHQIIADGLEILVNLTHRGACGCDETTGSGDRVVKLITVDVEFVTNCRGRTEMREVPDTVREWPAGLVLLAMGFTGPEPDSIVNSRGLKLDERGNIQTDRNYRSNVPGIFAAGDANRGQSLIVWAISEGREAARCVDTYLMGTSILPVKGGVDL
jgi:alkyl hydroperoxide reductase subunit AhpF